jgi:prepilin-type N-terminal cleavage/methylation domain-containing protein
MTRQPTTLSCRGFSLVELLVALAITLLVTSAVFAMLDPAAAAFQVQPEAADTLQRLRAATDVLRRDVLGAGNGPSTARGPNPSALIAAAIFPARIGRRNPDAAGTFNDTVVSFWSVSAAAPQAALAAPLVSASGAATIATGPGCTDQDSSCGFRSGTLAAVFGRSGAWDLFSITDTQGPVLTLQHNLRDSAFLFAAGDTIAAATARTYYFRNDRSTGVPQLMRYDAAGGSDTPVIDHIVYGRFEYFGDPEPPSPAVVGAGEPMRATYGPMPPDAAVRDTDYAMGENCVFARSAGGAIVPRLATLATQPVLVPLAQSALTDGPWCPDAANPNRYDADLLRVREVVITLRAEAAIASLRGPAGPLFTRSGTARGSRFVPDRFSRVVVAPRALNAAR